MQYLPKPTTIDFLVFDQFSNHCMANCLEPFRAANTLATRELYRWNIVTLSGEPVSSSSDLRLMPDHAFAEAVDADYLFVIASYDFRNHNTLATRRALRGASKRYKTIVGLDAGPWLMAAAGLLDGHSCTVHWDIFDEFAEEFSHLDVEQRRYIWDGNVGTCGGAMVAFDLSVDLIRQLNDTALALDVAAIFMATREPHMGHHPLCKIPQVQKAIDMMQTNLEDIITIPKIANRLGTTPKQLHRAFTKDLGQSPQQTYRNLRLSFARHLLHTTNQPIQEVVLRTGYQNQSAFSRAFKTRFGQTPMSYRHRINTKTAITDHLKTNPFHSE